MSPPLDDENPYRPPAPLDDKPGEHRRPEHSPVALIVEGLLAGGVFALLLLMPTVLFVHKWFDRAGYAADTSHVFQLFGSCLLLGLITGCLLAYQRRLPLYRLALELSGAVLLIAVLLIRDAGTPLAFPEGLALSAQSMLLLWHFRKRCT